MGDKPIPDDILRDVAAESNYTVDEIAAAVEKLNSAVQQRITHHYDLSRLSSGPDAILDETNKEIWIAMDIYDIAEDLKAADVEMEHELKRVVGIAHLDHCQSYGRTVSLPAGMASWMEDPMLYPIRVEKSEEWQQAEFHMLQMFQAFVSRQEMSASEALDYWVTTHFNQDALEWSGYRGVGREAIRKNAGQAEDKIEEHGHGSGYEEENIRAESVDDIPEDGVYHEEQHRYYMPRREDVDEVKSELPDGE